MNLIDCLQLSVFIIALAALTKPLGLYLVRVFDPGARTFLDPVLKPIERLLYRFIGISPTEEQDWKSYAASLLIFSFVGMLFTYGILRLQQLLPLNPQGFGPVSPDLAFNTSASFTTNTNWQSYVGESTMSYFSQMVALTFHNFASAAVGGAVAAAFVRGIARDKMAGIGNFWVDLIRQCLYLYLPICLLLAVFLVSQGMIQYFSPYAAVKTLDTGTAQSIAQGPVASQVAIKMLGTNGGGFMNANAAHPYENPTPLSNFLQMLAIFAIPSSLTYYLGRMVKNQKHGWSVWSAMFMLFLAGALVCWWAESQGNPRLTALGVDAAYSSMEGKEVRFGIFNSALFAAVTTDASCGAVNAMHDSFTPLGGLVPLFNMQLGEVVFGGFGSGLYGILIFVVLAIFLAGLMIGRTPEYLGKKIEAFDVKVAALAILIPGALLLGFTAWATISRWGIAGLNNSGPHGFSEILYAFTSAINNNGSAFAGLSANTPWYNTTLGLAMSGRAVEAAGDVDVLLLDKTGTITMGNRQATEFFPARGVTAEELAAVAQLASFADETPEGKSIVVLAKEFGLRGRELHDLSHAQFVPFTAKTRMSGVDVAGQQYRKGAADAVRGFIGADLPAEVEADVNRISQMGGTPLVVESSQKVFGVVYLKDIVKGGLPDRFKRFRAMGIRTIMITGDNPLTAATIAKEAGLDDFLAEARPEDKLALIRREQAAGHLVAMTGDGTNDAPALAQADVGVAMNSGTQAAKEAGNMVDLDSNPTKLIEIVEIGKQLLMTRGALTTFSVANDVAKYFAIIPAMLVATFPQIAALNVMNLHSSQSAILSAIIFNALIIVALIPIALRGVTFRPRGAVAILRRNLLIYGLGGIIAPFIGIKLIDIAITWHHLA